MRARDIMETVTGTLSPDDTLGAAVRRMQTATRKKGRYGVKGMPVLSETGEVIGILSIKDILRTIVPHYLKLTPLGEFTWDGMLEEMARRVADKKVGEVMSTDVVCVPEDASLMECADLVLGRNVQRLPVVDAGKRLVGIVYLRDLYYAITRALMDHDAGEDA